MDDSTEFRAAAANGDFVTVSALIKKGVDVNHGGKNNQSALHWASQCGSIEICRLLVVHGAKVNAKNDHNVTPIMMAVSSNHRQLVEFFLTHHVDINDRNDKGDTVLHIAAKRGHVELLVYLCQEGADVNRRNNLGQLPEDILPTSVEREISQWNNVVNGAIFSDDIPISRAMSRIPPSSLNGSSSSTASDSSEHHPMTSECGSVVYLNDQTRIPSLRLVNDAPQNPWSLVKSKVSSPEAVPNSNDLTLISRIYLKYQNQRTDRLGRLLNQWKKHEELKVRLRRMIHDEIEDELKKCQIQHL